MCLGTSNSVRKLGGWEEEKRKKKGNRCISVLISGCV